MVRLILVMLPPSSDLAEVNDILVLSASQFILAIQFKDLNCLLIILHKCIAHLGIFESIV